ncbi:hypothetical protein N5C43_17480 [Comamonas terrigena]|jgi:hypothetical protein|uniref:hypothetical protein n=1 Tax=Comamonas terrigena TaxID=32013 RepID=UPI0024496A31|nr:hypothetical protein [Comamonas terrigena]MDH1293038.1 hypothetical protein [Comamonas terrigena]
MENQQSSSAPEKFAGLGLGLFILAASLLTLGEYFGIVPKDLKWGLPTIGIIWGVTLVVRAISRK